MFTTNKKIKTVGERKVWRAHNKIMWTLEKQPKTKAYFLTTKGPAFKYWLAQPFELLEHEVELLE